MIGELTYNELLYSPDLVAAVSGLSDADLCAALEHLQAGLEKSWPAQRVQGVCILDASRRFEKMKRTTDPTSARLRRTSGHGSTRMEEITHRANVDCGHGTEVAE
jgi:hypothetical protein